jgi:6-phosphogluconolactonase (cycloisomerase 2 family)
MKFTKFGKALLISALSAGVVCGVTSCVESYAVGYLYVTGTVTAQSSGAGIISGFSIDHNTGKPTPINGLPIASGGSNPERAVLIVGSRFLYVLNRGTNASGGADCTTSNPCQNANITQFAVGANGILTPQETFYTQGLNPFRLVSDSSGSYLYALDHDTIGRDGQTPASAINPNPNCALALGSGVSTCGDITAFKIDSTTGRLSLLVNAQVTTASGSALPYFPIPANPVDFVLAGGYFYTLSGTASTNYPYTGGSTVFPYTQNPSTGQLTVTQTASQPLNIAQGTAIVTGSGYVYVLDNEPVVVNGVTSYSQIVPYQPGSNGALQAQIGGAVPDDPTQSNPITLLVESKGKWVYVANQGNNSNNTNAQSGIMGYVVDPSTHILSPIAGGPFGSGAGPQCLVEDPSDQFVFTANFNDSTVTGRMIDQNSGTLKALNAPASTALSGPATWCVMNGRTN